jgi:heme-degrading monooxygenase HmoA
MQPASERMTDPTLMRLFGFRPVGSGAELDAALRDQVLPGLLEAPGITDVYVARGGTEGAGERVIVSIWESRDAMTAELGEASVIGRFQPERVEDLMSSRLDVLPLAIDMTYDRPAAPTILRVYRGRVRPGELDNYIEEARAGALADAHVNPGLVALYMGTGRPTRFITVSAWTGWEAIEQATGGDIRTPVRTRNSTRIALGTAAHYEILPLTGRPAVRADESPPAIDGVDERRGA